MTTELKNALKEHHSNKNFTGVKEDWIGLTSEIQEIEYQNRILERSRLAQETKLIIIKDIGNEVERIREKLKEGKLI